MNEIKIAIHNNKGSASERWIEYCEMHQVNYKLVDCTKSDIIDQLKDCDGLMWHWHHENYIHKLVARQLTLSIEKMGKKVFPNSNTCWHFDDKVGQKYLFEAISAPLVKSYVFYTKEEALAWIKKAEFPKVFKLRGGAGSFNVKLIKNKRQARKKVNVAFKKGFPAYSNWQFLKEKLRILFIKKNYKSFKLFLKSIVYLFFPQDKFQLLPREKGYVYFQDFIAKLNIDTRLIVIGNRCFGTTRYVRKNDFRASGSGIVDNSPDGIDSKMIEIAFTISEKLQTQSLAFDFIRDGEEIKVVEMSYAFPVIPSDGIPGYWDRELIWHEGIFKSQYWMIENFISDIKLKNVN